MTRQEIWDRIKELGGRDEFILHEMKRLGFWDVSEGVPQLSESLREQRKSLEGELKEALQQQAVYKNKKKMLRDMRQKRMAEAKARRVETKERRERQRAEKAAAWAEAQQQDIGWLGPAVSAGLQQKESNVPQLESFGLPVFNGVKGLAEAMNLPLNELRFLAFDRQVSRTCHYQRFKVAKKTGGFREISAPAPRLKKAQHWILDHLLYKLQLHEAAHGFVPQRSILSNALPHVGAQVVINMDVKDFFPSVSYRRVKGVFQSLGYSEQLATILGLICTEPQTDEVTLDGQRFFVAKGDRRLPQGAPTSPAITNILCRGLDRRFEGMAKALGWTYTRYADDLTFSKKATDARDVNRVLWQARQIVENEGFVLHPDKIKVMRKGTRQEVTGVVVNEKPNVSRAKLKQFRAVLHRIETQGLSAADFGKGQVLESIQGFANYVWMINPEKGAALKAQVKNILAKPELQQVLAQKNTYPEKGKVAIFTPYKDKEVQPLSTDWWRLW
ncbi:MAG: RNA-directed DNA polymerase [Saprospiraceae bacterium]|nr:RNA-directed DNA polymerase [Saprospiraceae bacterium]